MTKNELMEIVKEAGFGNYAYEAAGMFEELANAILERAAVECHQGVARMSNDIDGTAFYIATGQCATAIRSLKLPTN